jgi:ferric-dicitrate binding protein FerR (iron transport regulator)
MNTDLNHVNIKTLISDVLSGSATPEEHQKLKEWLSISRKNRLFFKKYQTCWLSAKIMDNPIGFDAEAGYRRFLSKTQKTKSNPVNLNRFHRRIVKLHIPQVAAMLAFFMLGIFSYHYFNKSESPKVAYYEAIIPLGAKSQIVLIDGTKVWLNAGSRLRYPTTYSISNREVILEGEAFFEVATNKLLPFEVKTSMLNVKATGTCFNVKAYANDSTIETILVEGTIEISRIQNGKTKETAISLQPNQRLTLLKKTNKMIFESSPKNEITQKSTLEKKPKYNTHEITELPATTNYMTDTSWKDKRWRIESEELQSLAIKLERRYDVRILFADKALQYYRFSGTLENEPIEAVLKVMAKTAPVTYEVKGAEIVLSINEKSRKEYKNLWQKTE